MDSPEAEDRVVRQQRSNNQEPGSKLEQLDSGRPAPSACFDCNICLDSAVEPVVTLCGHLYCWPCIYKWLRLESTTSQQCPVCKAALSPATLVPLYGRGGYSNGCKDVPRGADIPRRPSTTLATSASVPASASMFPQRVHQHPHFNHHHQQQQQRRQHGNHMVSSESTATRLPPPTMLGGTAIAVLPWVLGEEWMGSHHLISSNNSPRLRRQEMLARRSLHRISIFLFCCVVLCLLVF